MSFFDFLVFFQLEMVENQCIILPSVIGLAFDNNGCSSQVLYVVFLLLFFPTSLYFFIFYF